ncbi:MAG: hypothetical protein IJ086_00640 [Clostridium sp.]|nr:hypothetical protein [Clostridium sp.]
MKFKNISKILITGLLFNSYLPCFAGTLLEGGRYEYFEGDNIVIDNILEENNIDLEIEGNTLINYIDLSKYASNGDSSRVTINSNNIIFNSPNSWSKAYCYFNLKPNTTYTVSVTGENASDIKTSSYIRLINDVYSKDVITATPFEPGESSTRNKSFTTNDTGEVCFSLESGASSGTMTYKNIMLFEGNFENKYINYFNGMKSVGELEDKFEINTTNKNFFDTSSLYAQKSATEKTDDINIEVHQDSIRLSKKNTVGGALIGKGVKCEKGKTYRIGFEVGENSDVSPLSIYFYSDKLWGNLIDVLTNKTQGMVSTTFIAPSDEIFIGCYLHAAADIGTVFEFKNIFVSEERFEDYEKSKNFNQEIILNEPMRVANNSKDRIIKKDTQWIRETNIGQYTINGSENWVNDNVSENNAYNTYRMMLHFPALKSGRANIMSDKFNFKTNYTVTENSSEGIFGSFGGSTLYIDILKEKVDNATGNNIAEKFKTWLSQSPVTITYELLNPHITVIEEELSFRLFEGSTYINSNSTIPANIKVTVDRTLNRAVEAVQLAKTNSTIENISNARYWSNLLKESSNKDVIQNNINAINDIKGLNIEKKTASANVDLYIKPKNALSISLNTNSIVFDNYSSVESLEKLNAVQLDISSSLPYTLNACLETPIQNKDNTITLDPNIINVRENSNIEYKAFRNVNDKLLLLDDVNAGNNNIHNIDIKLIGSNHKSDIYKTTIKFEVIQK